MKENGGLWVENWEKMRKNRQIRHIFPTIPQLTHHLSLNNVQYSSISLNIVLGCLKLPAHLGYVDNYESNPLALFIVSSKSLIVGAEYGLSISLSSCNAQSHA